MTEYIMTENEYKEDIIDFINYVFSQNHHPHDFKTLMPKSYCDEANGLGAVHYVIREDGKIKALLANRIIDLSVCEKSLRYGCIGNVSVHPYSRGKGYMKELMNKAIEDARKRDIDVLVLSGQRQRYGYFGFEPAGTVFEFVVSRSNIRHAMKQIDTSGITFLPFEKATKADIHKAKELYERSLVHTVRDENEFPLILKTWSAPAYTIHINDATVGYCYGPFGEIVLEEEADFPRVLKALFEKEGVEETTLSLHPHFKERIAYLSQLCEHSTVRSYEQIKVLNWTRAIDTLLTLKSACLRLADGVQAVCIGNEVIKISVTDGIPKAEQTDSCSDGVIRWNEVEALSALFGLDSLLNGSVLPYNWAPLPLPMDAPDSY